jgi:tetratricopeptide (TPR) repeat protein
VASNPPQPPRGGRRSGGRGDAGRGAGRSGSRESGKRIEGPGGAREPIGRERATRRRDAPPRVSRRPAAPVRPELPPDEEPALPKGVRREIDRTLGAGRRADDVALALSIGSAAIEDERPDVALEVLAWAKHEAPRVAPIREAYGVALYLAERFDDALSELQAYRRLTGRPDQNHLIADCLRALGRDVDRIAETAEGLLADTDAPLERRAEAAIVWAAALADADELGPARAVLRRFLESARGGDREELVRARWFAGDLADRAGDLDDARTHLAAVVDVDPGFLDASERLRELDTRGG